MNSNLLAYALDFTSFLLQNLKEDSSKISQIILFGSVARHEATSESDIDLFIETTHPQIEPQINLIKEQFYNSFKTKKYWNLLNIQNEINCSIGELKDWPDLERSIIAQGIILYGKYHGKPSTKQYYLFTVTPSKNRNKNVAIWRELYGYTQKVGKKNYIKQGLIKQSQGQKLAKSIFIIPIEQTQQMIHFLQQKKVKYILVPIWKE